MTSNKKIRFLVFSGGGAAGYAYAGAVDQLYQEPEFSYEKLEGIAGTSVGSIAALLVALNYQPEEIIDKFKEMDFKEFEDGGSLPAELIRLFKEYGIYKGRVLYQFIKDILKEKLNNENATFADLKAAGYKDLYVIATKFYVLDGNPTGKKKVFSFKKHADTPIADVILASCAASPFFPSVPLKKEYHGKYKLDKEGHLFGDGGFTENFDINLFDTPTFNNQPDNNNITRVVNPDTLGLALLKTNKIIDQNHKPTKDRISDGQPILFLKAVTNTLLKNFDYEHLDEKVNRDRTVQIDRLGVAVNDFGIDEKKKSQLIESGRLAVKDYFQNLRAENNENNNNNNQVKEPGKTTNVINASSFWQKPKAKKAPANDRVMKELDEKKKKGCCNII